MQGQSLIPTLCLPYMLQYILIDVFSEGGERNFNRVRMITEFPKIGLNKGKVLHFRATLEFKKEVWANLCRCNFFDYSVYEKQDSSHILTHKMFIFPSKHYVYTFTAFYKF